MKGLILKDLYSIRLQIVLSLLIFLLPNLYLINAAVDSIAAAPSSEDKLFMDIMYTVLSYVSITACSSLVINTVSEDVSCGWLKLAGTMPLTARKICLSKIISSAIVLGMLGGISLLVNIFGAVTGTGDAEALIATPICTVLIQLTVISPVFPFAMRFGSRKASPFYICFLMATMLLLCAVIALSLKSQNFNVLRVVLYGAIPLASAVSVTASAVCGRKLLECE